MIRLLTFLHFLVDGLCACALFMLLPVVSDDMMWTVFVTYNALAFLTQPFTGQWVDLNENHWSVLIVSAVLLLLGAVTAGCGVVYPADALHLGAAVLLGLGNSCFHVYGGKWVCCSSRNDMSSLGIFVSTGALGLVLGQCFSSLWLLGVMTLVLLGGVWGLYAMVGLRRCRTSYFSQRVSHGSRFIIVFCILVAVFARSFWGEIIPRAMHWEGTWIILLLGFLAMAGKAFGGYLATMVGTAPAFIGSMILAGVCFLLSDFHDVWICSAVFLVNVSMPITLYWVNRLYPHREGYSFGLLAAMLIIGLAVAIGCEGSQQVFPVLRALVVTLIVETLVLLFLREQRWQVLAAMALMNIATNVPLNLFGANLSLSVLLGLELVIVIVEAVLYCCVIHDIRRSIIYSLVCNVASLLIGTWILMMTMLG